MTTYRVGDPDPTPNPGGDCPAANGAFLCTWPTGHDGPHVAGTRDEIAAVWNTGDPAGDSDQALKQHLATCKGCSLCHAVRELFHRVDRDVNGDLDNWKPTGFLNAPPQVGHRPDDAPPGLTVVPEGLDAPLDATSCPCLPDAPKHQHSVGGYAPPSSVQQRAELLGYATGNVGYCNAAEDHGGFHGQGPNITDASRMCGQYYFTTGPLAGLTVTQDPDAAHRAMNAVDPDGVTAQPMDGRAEPRCAKAAGPTTANPPNYPTRDPRPLS